MRIPTDLTNLTDSELGALADEIRTRILTTVSKNGGHLGSNLGMVEPTIALHKVFRSPEDKIIFDVSHQCYAHKILTGRENEFATLHEFGGLTGYTNPEESKHDIFFEGHSGSSLSEALGIATANREKGLNHYTIAVIGDGSFSNGMIFEALNNCAGKDLNLIILLNDNEMSISENVGGMHEYFSKIRTSRKYFRLKHRFSDFLSSLGALGRALTKFGKLITRIARRIFVGKNMFINLGLDYIGVIDGSNISKLCGILEEAKTRHRVCVVHIATKKGAGYSFAEEHPERYHSVSPFDLQEGVPSTEKESFSSVFGQTLCDLAKNNPNVCAVTAAMRDGTGLSDFSKRFESRFFDVGISEEHAVTFCAGLAKSGLTPVCALYSTFAQRSFDQLLEDIALQKLPMVLALDRAGLVEYDGYTHQGIFDVSLFSSIPNVQIVSPETYAELKTALQNAVSSNALFIVRYPKGAERTYDRSFYEEKETYTYTKNVKTAKTVLITYGAITEIAEQVRTQLGTEVAVLKLKKIFPLDYEEIGALVKGKTVFVLEEGIQAGGIGEKISARLNQKTTIFALSDFVPQGNREELLHFTELDAQSVSQKIKKQLKESL